MSWAFVWFVLLLSIRQCDEVAKVLRQIEMNPYLYPRIGTGPYRKATLSTFPFCIYYCVATSKVAIVAIHDARRDPRI